MRIIELNHAHAQQRAPWLARWLLVAGGLAMAALATTVQQVNAQAAALEASADKLRQPHRTSTQPQAQTALQREEIAAAQVAMAELALPWEPLFKALEQTRNPRVKLMGMEPDPKRHKLRITAEASEPQDMLDYVLLLGQQPMLREVFLLHHERAEGDDAGIRFAVEAVWDMKS